MTCPICKKETLVIETWGTPPDDYRDNSICQSCGWTDKLKTPDLLKNFQKSLEEVPY